MSKHPGAYAAAVFPFASDDFASDDDEEELPPSEGEPLLAFFESLEPSLLLLVLDEGFEADEEP